ncbi:collagen-like protein, partial [Patescibacteria group bacterium]|nr:collagen-like protein [Patescibacteria group bacterium]
FIYWTPSSNRHRKSVQKNNMKKIKLYIPILVLALLVGTSVVSAKDDPNGNPFQALWDAVNYLQERMDNIELMPGPEGLAGQQGEKGDKGDSGEPSWDESRVVSLENRITELEELLSQPMPSPSPSSTPSPSPTPTPNISSVNLEADFGQYLYIPDSIQTGLDITGDLT